MPSSRTPTQLESSAAAARLLSAYDSNQTDLYTDDEGHDEDSDTDSDYQSFDSSSSDEDDDTTQESVDEDEEKRKAEREARALERQRVLEAAGLIVVKQEGKKPPPRPVRRSKALVATPAKTHRKAPAPPIRTGAETEDNKRLSVISTSSDVIGAGKELPPVPSSPALTDEGDTSMRLDDAYDRYEAYKAQMAEGNRWSVASSSLNESGSAQSIASTNVPPSPSTSASLRPSRSHETLSSFSHHSRTGSDTTTRSYGSSLLHLLGRSRTPVEEGVRERPVISAPILNVEGGSPARENTNSPAFGSVSPSTYRIITNSPILHLVVGQSGG